MQQWKERLSDMMQVYGPVALGVWFAVFALTWLGFWLGLMMGFDLGSTAGSASLVLGAYVLTQATKPIRVLVTLALTPGVARLVGRGPTENLSKVPEPDPTPGSGDENTEAS